MSQRRIWNFGDTFTSERATTAAASLHEPGVYVGYDVSLVDTDTLSLSPGWLLLPSGILVGETTAIELTISPLPAAAAEYTIVVRHTDADIMGGQAATYAIEPGLLPQSVLTNGVAIAYIRYPGGAVPLVDYFITPARKVLGQAEDSPHLVPTVLLAPFTYKWLNAATGANTTFSNVWVSPNAFTRIETSGLGPVPPGFEVTTVIVPLTAGRFRPVSVVVRAIIDPNSQMLVAMRDTDGNAVTLTGSTLSPVATFSDLTVSVDPSSGVFTEGDSYTLELTFRTPSLDSVDLQSLTVNYDPLP
jgi:hypothetical protein